MALSKSLFFLLSICICFSHCSGLHLSKTFYDHNDNSTVIDTNNLSTDELIQKLVNLTITKHGGSKLWNEQNYQNQPSWAPPQWFWYIFPPEIREIMRHYIYQSPPQWLQYSQPNYCYYYCTPYQQPGNQYQQPGNGYQQPGNSYQQPGNGYQQPGNGYQQPGNGYQQPGYQQPPGNQQPGNGRQQPGTGNQQPPTGYQQPGNGCAPTSTRVYDSCSANYQASAGFSCETTNEGCCQAAASVSNECANADPIITFLKNFCCHMGGR